MPRNNQSANPMARQALDKFKFEVANEIGLGQAYQSGDLGNLTSRQNGTVGGYMTKKMIQLAEQQLANDANLTQQLASSAGQDHRSGATTQKSN